MFSRSAPGSIPSSRKVASGKSSACRSDDSTGIPTMPASANCSASHSTITRCGPLFANSRSTRIEITASGSFSLVTELGDVDHETVFHVALQHALVGLVDVGRVDHFDLRHDAVLRAEV